MAQRRKKLLWAEECQSLTSEQMEDIKAQFHPQADGSNVNIKPDIISGLGDWENYSIPTSSASAITMPHSGYIAVRVACTNSGDGTIVINNKKICFLYTGGNANTTFVVFVKKGDIVYAESPGNASLPSQYGFARFYND